MIIANWKSNGELMMIQDWTSDFINSCSPKDFYVGIAPPVIYISDFSSERNTFTSIEAHKQVPPSLQQPVIHRFT